MKLVNIGEVADLMRSSVSTIRRRLAAARSGESSFPLPIFGNKKKALWRQDDILTWNESLPDTPNVPNDTPATRQRRIEITRNQLRELGIKIGDGNSEVDDATR